MPSHCYVLLPIIFTHAVIRASLVAQTVKNPPTKWETWVLSLGWEDPLKEGMATHSSMLAWRIPWTEEPGWLQFMESQEVGRDEAHSTGGHAIIRVREVARMA